MRIAGARRAANTPGKECRSNGTKGPSIGSALGLAKGGRVSGAFSLLAEAGFVAEDDARDPETGRVPRERRWRLRDNYARYFLKYVKPVAEAIDSGSFEIARLESLEGIESELSAKAYSGSMTGMSMLRLREEKLMPTRVTGRGPPFHLSA